MITSCMLLQSEYQHCKGDEHHDIIIQSIPLIALQMSDYNCTIYFLSFSQKWAKAEIVHNKSKDFKKRRALFVLFSEFAVARPSACRLSVTLVLPTQAVVIVGNFSTAFGNMTIR